MQPIRRSISTGSADQRLSISSYDASNIKGNDVTTTTTRRHSRDFDVSTTVRCRGAEASQRIRVRRSISDHGGTRESPMRDQQQQGKGDAAMHELVTRMHRFYETDYAELSRYQTLQRRPKVGVS